MTDPVSFVLACVALLAAPGPTNALLATSGATVGAMRSVPLVAAVIAGYALSVSIVALVLAPVVEAWPWLDIGLRLGCGAYLGWAAWKMWGEGGDARNSDPGVSEPPVRPVAMLVATLLNPKGMVAALEIIPHFKDGRLAEATPFLVTFAALVAAASLVWIGIGAVLKSSAGSRIGSGMMRRTGAGVLGVFGLLMAGSAVPAVIG